ncbi:MAG: (2Fe-2S)-binding protein [Bacteroidales bacterium]
MQLKSNTMICYCNKVDYITIRKAMVAGARTEEDILKATGAAGSCGRCKTQIKEILASVCGCTNTSMDEVLNSVKNGANTVKMVSDETQAGSCCGKCQPLIQNVIDLQR